MKIYFFENSAEDNAIVSSLILGHELFFSDKKLNVENADSAADADIISVFVNSVVNKEIQTINFNVGKAIESLGERRTAEANRNQQFAMTSINNLAFTLSTLFNK